MKIETTLSTAEIQARYGLSRTTAWRARKRGWAEGAAYHRRRSHPAERHMAISQADVEALRKYVRQRLPKAPGCDVEDIASNVVLLALNRGVKPDDILAYLVGIAKIQIFSYWKQGIRSIELAVENWDYNY